MEAKGKYVAEGDEATPLTDQSLAQFFTEAMFDSAIEKRKEKQESEEPTNSGLLKSN